MRRAVRLTGVALLVAAGPVLLGACSDDKSSTTDAGGQTSTSNESTTSTTSAGGAVNAAETVEVTEFSFTPGGTEVAVGEAITFENVGSARHTVTPDVADGEDAPWVSTQIRQGETFVVTLSKPGEYAYFCSIHPDRMSGTITVTE